MNQSIEERILMKEEIKESLELKKQSVSPQKQRKYEDTI